MGEVLRPRPGSWREHVGTSADLGTIRTYLGEYPACIGPWRTHMMARHMAKATMDRYLLTAHQLDTYLRSVEIATDVGRLTRGDIEKFLAWGLEQGGKPSSINSRYGAL